MIAAAVIKEIFPNFQPDLIEDIEKNSSIMEAAKGEGKFFFKMK